MIQDTSLEAYKSILNKLGEKQKEVLEIIKAYPSLTNTELAQKLNWSINRVTPRVFELRQLKLVIECMKRNCSITNRKAITWVAK